VNPQFRTVALIAASLGLLVSLYIALRPDDDSAAPATTSVAPTTTETATGPPATTAEHSATTAPKPPDVITIRIAVPADAVPKVRRYSVRKGRTVVLVVTSQLAEHVHLHGYDLMADVAPGKRATMRFTASVPGRFEIELEDRGLEIAELEVRP
jgi:hypothetical protein